MSDHSMRARSTTFSWFQCMGLRSIASEVMDRSPKTAFDFLSPALTVITPMGSLPGKEFICSYPILVLRRVMGLTLKRVSFLVARVYS
jgi:hypothetical protein